MFMLLSIRMVPAAASVYPHVLDVQRACVEEHTFWDDNVLCDVQYNRFRYGY